MLESENDICGSVSPASECKPRAKKLVYSFEVIIKIEDIASKEREREVISR